MTTIAYHHKSKTIAYNSQSSAGGIIANSNANKMHERNGVLFFVAGVTAGVDDLIKSYFGESLLGDPECDAFVVAGGVVYYCYVDNLELKWIELNSDAVIGTGQPFALAAMDFGKSAKEAVKYAITRDIYSGGRVREFKLK